MADFFEKLRLATGRATRALFGVVVFICAFSTTNSFADGYVCSSAKQYTSCKSGYYMTYNGSYDGTPKANNACTQCTAGYKCSGGTANRVACSTMNTTQTQNITNGTRSRTVTYSSGAGASSCTASYGSWVYSCDAGTYANGSECSACTGASYINADQSGCIACPDGYTADTSDGKTSITQCKKSCSAGNYYAADGYEILDYIQSSGTQMIDTGVSSIGIGMKTQVKVRLTSSSTAEQAIIGRTAGKGYEIYFTGGNTIGSYHDSNGTQKAMQTISYNTSTDYIITSEMTSNKITQNVNGTISTYSGTLTTTPSTGNLTLFKHVNSYAISARLYYATFWQNGTLVRNFVPVKRKSDSAVGLYDTVNGVFYANTGTGSFTAGTKTGDFAASCSSCPAGKYCSGTTFAFGASAAGITGNCNAGTYSTGGASAATCTACTTTSGWTTTSPAGSGAYTACYQTQTPSHCASGTIKRTASSISGTTITYGSASVTSALSSNSGYYVNGTSCSQCSAGTYYGGGTATSCTACTTTSGWTTTSPAGSGAYTACYQTQTPSNCASGTIKRTASSISGTTITYGSASVTSALSSNSGYYVNGTACSQCGAGTYYGGGTATSCTACTTTSGWTTTSPAGSGAYTACYQTQTPSNCASGTIKRTASSISGTTITYGSASVTSALSSNGGYYVNGTACSQCTAGTYYGGGTATACNSCSTDTSSKYTSSAAGADKIGKCYLTLTAGKQVASAGAGASNCSANSYCTSTSNIYYNSDGGTTTYTGTTCTSGTSSKYTKSAAGADKIGKCYLTLTAGQQVASAGAGASNCSAGRYCTSTSNIFYNTDGGTAAYTGTQCVAGSYSTAGASSCTACGNGKTSSAGATSSSSCTDCTAISGSAGWATTSWNSSNNTMTNLCTTSGCSANYYKSGNTCPSCSSGTNSKYTKSSAGTTTVNNCYLTTTAGKYITSANAGTGTETACTAGSYCPSTTIYYGGTHSSSHPTYGGINGCPTSYPSSAASSSKQGQCYLTLTAGQQVASAGAGASNCSAGRYCTSTGNIYYNTDGGTATYTGTACATGSYSSAGSSTCTACPAGKTTSGTGTAFSTSADNTCSTACSAIANRSTWGTQTWKASDNTVTGLCSVGTCVAGAYKSGNTCPVCSGSTYSAEGASSCTACPGSMTISGTAVTDHDAKGDCKITCSAGNHLAANASACTSCPAGKYCSSSGTYGFNASSAQGITGNCNANTYSTGGASAASCTACTTVTFACNGTDTTSNSTCPDGSTTRANATATSQAYDQTCHRTTSDAGSTSASACSGSATHNSKSYSGKTCYVTSCQTGYSKNQSSNATACNANCNEITLNANSGTAGSVATLYKKTDSGTWYSNNSCTTTWTGSTTVKPTRSGWTFRGFYTSSTDATDISSSQTNGAARHIMDNGTPGGTGNSWTINSNTTLYAGWARNCTQPSNSKGSCTLSVAQNTTYTTTCNAGYTLGNSGAYNPTCTANCNAITLNKNASDATAGSVTTLYKYTDGTTWYSSKTNATTCATEWTGNSNIVPSRSGYTFRGFYTSAVSDITANNTSQIRYITNAGAGSTTGNSWTINAASNLYAGWMKNCAAGTGANCSTNIDGNSHTYNTSCKGGYGTLSGGGTNAPSCTQCSAGTASADGNNTCSVCTTDNTYSAAGAASCSSCPTGYSNSGTTATAHANSSSCTITVTAGHYIGTSGQNSSNWGTCANWTYKAQHTVNYGSTSSCDGACPAAETSAGWAKGTGTGWGAVTDCYETHTPSNCASGTTKKHATNSTTWGSEVFHTTLKANANYYTTTSATSCTACPTAYPTSAANTNSGQSACYKSCSAGYYWKGSSEACTACTAGNWCAGTTANYTTTSDKGLSSCSSNLGTGYTSTGGTGDTANTKCYLTLSGKVRSGTSGTTTTDCNSGKYKGSHNEYYGTSYSCDTCSAGTYSGTSGAITSCSNCEGRTKYSGSGASSCSTVTSGYYTTGCNSSGNLCTGQSQCTGRTKYCSSGVENTVSSGYYTTGCTSNNGCTGQTQCSGSTYCASGVQNNCPTADSGWTAGTGTGWTARTSCFEYQTPANCASGSVQRNGNSSANSYSSTITLRETLKANANSWTTTTATSCSTCPTAYPTSAANTNSGQSACYKSCSAGYYWKGSSEACTACTAGNWCAGTTAYYTTSSNQGLSSCSSNLGTGYTSAGGTGDTANTKCYLTLSGKVRSGTTGTATTNCNSGSYKASHNEYYGTSYSCDTCSAGTYSGTSGAITSCSNCEGRTKYSGSGASSCSTVTSGYYTTGCNSSGNLCTGQSQCTGRTKYCSSGVENTVSSGYYTTGCTSNNGCTGQTQCSGSTYCASGVQNNCPTADSGWTAGTGTGWTEYGNCYEKKTGSSISSYCSAGELRRAASSTSAYSSTVTTATALKAVKGAYVNGQTCSQCTGATYQDTAGSAATSCTACPTQTSGWTRGTGTGWESVTSCYETRTPANCASGTIKHNATDSSTWGSASVTGALSANAGYYVNSTACSACGGNGYYCPGGTTARATVSSGYYSTGGDSNTRTGQSKCTGATYCSGGVKSNCPSGYDANTTNGKTANTQCQISVSGGHYIGTAGQTSSNWGTCGAAYYKEPHLVNYNSTSACSSCPSGYTANTTAGKSAISQCQASCSAGNYMASGTYTKLEYLQSTGTQYINTGLTVNGGDITATAVFAPTTLDNGEEYSAIFGRNSNFQAAYTSAGKAHIGNAVSSGTYFAANTTATVSGTLSSTAANKYYVNNTDTGLSRTYGNSLELNLFSAEASQYRSKGKMYSFTAERNDETIMNLIPARRNSDSVLGMLDLVSGAFFTNAGTGTFTAGPDVGVIGGTCGAVGSGYYAAARTIDYGSTAPRSECPSSYHNTATGASSQNNCYLTTAEKKYVATAGAGQTDCVAGTYCAGGTTIYYGGTHSDSHKTTGGSTQCPSGSFCVAKVSAATACSSLSGVSPSGGTYTSAAGSTANTACKYTAPSKTITGCATVTSQQVTYSGSAWPASTYGVTANGGYIVANNNSSSATCSQCSAGTYSAGGSATSCSNCTGRNQYSGAGASSCSAPGDGYYTTGCTSGNNCTGKSACGDGNYCKSGVQTACTTTSGWTTATGTTTASAYTSCYQTQTPANCASGTIKRTASSISSGTITYGSASVTSALSSKGGYYVNGAACSQCAAGTYYGGGTATSCNSCSTDTSSKYTSSAAGADKIGKCYLTLTAGKQVATAGAGASNCAENSYCTSTSNIYYNSDGGTTTYTGTTCTSGTSSKYTKSVAGADKIGKCYLTLTAGQKVASAGAGAANCDAGKYCTSTGNIYYNSDGGTAAYTGTACATGSYSSAGSSTCTACPAGKTTSGTGTAFSTSADNTCSTACSAIANRSTWGSQTWSASNNSVTGLCSVGTCVAGAYKSGNTCPVCGDNKYSDAGASSCSSCNATNGYGNIGTAASAHAGSTSCTVTCSAGNYVAETNGACVGVGDGYYRAGNETVAYGSKGSRNACSSISGVSVSGGSYGSTGSRNASSTCTYTAPTPSLPTYCATKTSNTVTYSGTAWPTSTYAVTANAGSIIVDNNTADATCEQCSGANYSAGGSAASCTACPTQTSGWTRGTGTGWSSYSSCYETQKPAHCESGSVKHTAKNASEWNTAVSLVSTLTASNGYYASSSATSCSACPSVTSGYSYVSGTGWTAITQCKETKPYSSVSTNCYSGALTKTANSGGTWDTAVSTLTAKAGYKTSGSGDSTTCSACGDGYYSSNGNDGTCDACTTTSGWATHTTSNTAGTYEACYQTRTPANCASGNTKRTASSISSGTITYGNESVENTLSSSANYYVNGTTCTGCPSGYPNSAGGTGGVTQCYSNDKSRPWSGNQVNGATPTGCTVTSWNTCSNSACDYVAYANAAGTGDGTIKSGCPTNNANCTKTVKTVSANNGYYAASNATSCTACPALTDGYSFISGTGWNTYSDCVSTKSVSACASGALTRTADSASTWAAPVSTLSAGANKYVTGSGDATTCTGCPSGYPNSAGGTGGVTQCYSNDKSRAWTGSQTECTNPDTTGCSGFTCGTCSNPACDYVAYANAAGTGDGTIKSGCSTNNSACQKPVASLTAKANYYVNGTTSCPTCTSKNSSYPKSDGGDIGYGKCYVEVTRGCTKNNGSTPSNCSVTAYNDCSCTGDTYKSYADSTTSGTTTNETCIKTVKTVSANAGYYVDGLTCPICTGVGGGLYPNSNAGNTGGASACYTDEISGKYVAANATVATNCAAGSYKGTHQVNYGSSSSCSVCDSNKYSDAGSSSCTACATTNGYGNSGATANDHAGVTSCTVSCPGGSYVATSGGACVDVTAGYYKAAHTVAQTQTSTRGQCATGLTTIGYGAGADEAGDCGRVLHTGTGELYLRSDKKTEPSLNVKIGNTTYYGNMSTSDKVMSDGQTEKLKVKDNGTTYSVYDDSVN